MTWGSESAKYKKGQLSLGIEVELVNNSRGLRLLVGVVLAAFIFTGCVCTLWEQPESGLTTVLPPVVTGQPADWSMFRFSLDRSGYNATEDILKPPLELKWKFKAKSKI